MSHFIKRTVKTVYRGSCGLYVSYIVPSTETHFFLRKGGSAYVKEGAYYKF